MAQFSVQTFTIREYLKNEKRMAFAIRELSAIGIRSLEAARLNFNLSTAHVFKRLCDAHDVKIGSSQIKFDKIQDHFDEIVKIHKLWGCRNTAVSVLPLKYLMKKEEGLKAFAVLLNQLGERLRAHQINLLFHHHHFEFLKFNGRTGLELLLEHTKPENVGLVLDTYWIQRSGKTPQDLIEKYAGRVKVIHLRDYKLKFSKLDLLPTDCEIGNGNLDFKKIIQTAISSGVEYMAIEQNAKDPFNSLKTSIENIKGLGFENLF